MRNLHIMSLNVKFFDFELDICYIQQIIMGIAVEVGKDVHMGPNKPFGPGIVGIGYYLPEEVRDNSWFKREKGLDTGDEWMIPRTGILTRHIAAANESTSIMAQKALVNALDLAGMKPEELDEIIIPTATEDYPFPSAANLAQGRLTPKTFTSAMGINQACNGGVRGLEIAFAYVAGHYRKAAAVAASETLSRFVDYKDRNSCVLFGDGAGAFIVAPVKDPGPYGFAMASDGTKWDAIIFEGGGSVYPTTEQTLEEGRHKIKIPEGKKVFDDAVEWMPRMLHLAMEDAGVKLKDLDWLFFHNANARIVEGAARKTAGSKELEDWCVDRAICFVGDMGNISAGSVPAAMTRAYQEGWLREGDLVGMAAVGAGINAGGAVVRWHVPNKTERPEGKFSDYHKWAVVQQRREELIARRLARSANG